MIPKRYLRNAKAAYFCDVVELVKTGMGRKYSNLEIHHLKTKYPTVEEWFESLPAAGKVRVVRWLEE